MLDSIELLDDHRFRAEHMVPAELQLLYDKDLLFDTLVLLMKHELRFEEYNGQEFYITGDEIQLFYEYRPMLDVIELTAFGRYSEEPCGYPLIKIVNGIEIERQT